MHIPPDVLSKLRKSGHTELNPICPYCHTHTKLVNGTIIYPHRYDLRHKQFYLCEDCNAYVGCHGGTTRPLGVPANAELRKARLDTHNKFDRLWKEENYIPRSSTANTKGSRLSRSSAYILLAAHMNLNTKDTHIGQFNIKQCQQALAFVKKYYDHT